MVDVSIHLPDGYPNVANKIVVDGQEITNLIEGLSLDVSLGGTQLIVRYPCSKVVVEGLATVVHYCPMAEEDFEEEL